MKHFWVCLRTTWRGEEVDARGTNRWRLHTLSETWNNKTKLTIRVKPGMNLLKKQIQRDDWQMTLVQKHLHFDVVQEQNEVKMTISRSLLTVVRFVLSASGRSRWINSQLKWWCWVSKKNDFWNSQLCNRGWTKAEFSIDDCSNNPKHQ